VYFDRGGVAKHGPCTSLNPTPHNEGHTPFRDRFSFKEPGQPTVPAPDRRV